MIEDITPVDVDPDGPGDLYVPFSSLRLRKIPAELRVTSKLYESITRTSEDPTLSGYGKASAWVGACLWGIEELERELVRCERGDPMAKKVDPFAKAIHDLCVAAGADCAAARKAADTTLKRTARTSGPRRRNLTVAEAERLARDGR